MFGSVNVVYIYWKEGIWEPALKNHNFRTSIKSENACLKFFVQASKIASLLSMSDSSMRH
jgi:hypothetical protein